MCNFRKKCSIPEDRHKQIQKFEEIEQEISKKTEGICHIHLLELARRLIAGVEEELE